MRTGGAENARIEPEQNQWKEIDNVKRETTMMKALAGALLLGSLAAAGAEQALELDNVVVTPTGSEQDAFDTSLPVNLIQTRDLEERIVVSVVALLRTKPGVDAVLF